MNILRSLLFIPADSEKKIAKAMSTGADAVIFDLEDAVAHDRKPIARSLLRTYFEGLENHEMRPQIWVRINALTTGMALDDLTSAISDKVDGIMLPKADGPQDVKKLSHYLDAFEVSKGIDAGQIKVITVATETAKAPFALGQYTDANLERLYGMTWGAEDLSAALSASTNLDADGEWTHTYKTVRSLMLMAAHAAGVQAIETLYVDYKDTQGLLSSSQQARGEGFSGRIAIHPAQVEAINLSFTPSEDEVTYAKRVVSAFEAKPESGTIGVDGRMLDFPHLTAARKTLQLFQQINT